MATFAHTITEQWADSGERLSKANSYSSTSTLRISEPVADSETDYEIACAIDVSEIKSIYILSDQDVLFEVNDNAGGGGSISLTADKPYIWTDDCYYTNLLAVDVTSVFITNASGSEAQIDIRVISDATP